VSRPLVASLARIVLVLAVAAAPLTLVRPALGHHGGRDIGSFSTCDRPVTPPRCTSVGNNLRHYVAFDPSLTPDLAQSLRDSMREDYDEPTKLELVEHGAVNALTDVVAFSADYGENGAAGWVYCPPAEPQGTNPAGHRWCKGQELHLNTNPRYGIFFDDDASRDHVVCHELGHTLGLRHWGNPPDSDGPVGATCMNANTPNGPTALTQFDLDHINAYEFRTVKEPRALTTVDPPAAGTILAASASGTLEATGPEAPRSLTDLVSAADTVVAGRIVAVESGRVFGTDRARLHYASLTVRVDRLLGGTLPAADANVLILEVPLWDGPDALERVRSATLGTDRILLLRSKVATAEAADIDPSADAGRYRLVTFGSEIIAAEGGLAEIPPDEHGYLVRFDGEAFDDVADALARMASAAK
jgi:hypothetical protein